MIFAYNTTYLCFQGELLGFISKDSILGEFRRSVEVRGSPGHQEQDNTRKIGEGTDGHECARPCTRTPARLAGQKSGTTWLCWVARPCHWARSGRASGGGGGFKSVFVLSRELFHSTFFSFLSSCLRVLERGLRESSKLRFILWICAFGLEIVKIKSYSTFKHQFMQVCSLFLFSLILVLGFCLFFHIYSIECWDLHFQYDSWLDSLSWVGISP